MDLVTGFCEFGEESVQSRLALGCWQGRIAERIGLVRDVRYDAIDGVTRFFDRDFECGDVDRVGRKETAAQRPAQLKLPFVLESLRAQNLADDMEAFGIVFPFGRTRGVVLGPLAPTCRERRPAQSPRTHPRRSHALWQRSRPGPADRY